MASHFLFSSSTFPSRPSLFQPTKPQPSKYPFHTYPPISCNSSDPKPHQDDKQANPQNPNNKTITPSLLQLSVTLTVISASLPRSSLAAKQKRPTKRSTEALTPQELQSWSKGLPIIENRIAYTDILDLKRQGKLKHIIKPSGVALKANPEKVLVVLDDSRVLKAVLPSLEGNTKFWDSWNELKIDSMCVNAYTPPIKKPEIPSPYLGFLARVPVWMVGLFRRKPMSKKALELKRMREDLERKRKEEVVRMRKEREMIERAMRIQKKEEERRKKMEVKKRKYEESLREARRNYQHMAMVWANLARDSNVATALGFVFFFIFYRTVVLSYRRQKKDYDDRLKIEKAEAEEKKKMRELERELEGIESEEDESQGGGGEQNPYMKMAMQFMKSGARVRRAHNKRLPQYLERGVDVKFTDVAGLGKIRLELEEIVKFFTHGEMYRRRGVKIPGQISLNPDKLVWYL